MITTDKKVLEQVSTAVDITIDKERIAEVCEALVAEASKHPTCVGLAAIQIGVPLRIFIIKEGDNWIPFINPEIMLTGGGVKTARECCMSFPGLSIPKRRFKEIVITWLMPSGERLTQKFKVYAARVIQHEYDHINGKSIINK